MLANIKNPNSPEVLTRRIKDTESLINYVLTEIDDLEISLSFKPDTYNERQLVNRQERLLELFNQLTVLGQRLCKFDGYDIEITKVIETYQNIIDVSSQQKALVA